MADTIQKYKDYVMTGFLKSVAPIVIDRASGTTVTDIHGREYLDCFAGISVVNAGHCNLRVVAAAKAQMDKLVHCSSYLYHVQPVADLAEKIAHIAPGKNLTKTFFGNGGAEAIEGALKLARLYTDKHEFISLQASFHGRSRGALSVTGNYARKKKSGPYAAGISFAPAPYVYRSLWPNDPEECARQCARATETGNYAMAKLRELQKKNSLIGEVRGLGLMIGVELVKDAQKTPATAEAEAIRDACLRKGMLIGVGGVSGNVVRFQPPLVIMRQQLDQALAIFTEALQEVAQPAYATA
jgi:4-aminobutyrate aminotransferase-like enzyme